MSEGKLKLEMKVGERRPLAQFELKAGETLEERVRAEIAKAAEEGNINSMSVVPTVPAVAVYEVGDDGETPAGSMAVFNAAGKEVTHRSYRLNFAQNEGRDYIQLEGVDKDDDDNEVVTEIGILYSEDTARRIGALWQAGVID